MNKLPPTAASLLAQVRAEDRAHRVDVERSLAALAAQLPFADAAAGAASDPAADVAAQAGLESAGAVGQGASVVGQGASALLAGKALKLVVATVALGGALGSGAWLSQTPASKTIATGAPRAVAVSAPAQARASRGISTRAPASATVPNAERAAQPVEIAHSAPLATPTRRSLRGTSRTAVASAPQTAPAAAGAEAAQPEARDGEPRDQAKAALPAPRELDLIDAALTSLRSGAAESALSRLELHERLYAQGTFAVERRGLRVLALCKLGRAEQAERERAAFLSAHPSAPIAARVRQACGAEGER